MAIVNTKGYEQDAEGQWWKNFKGGRKTRAQIKTCVRCGEDYPVWQNVESRAFCSVGCRAASLRVETPVRPCARCGSQFEARERDQRFCSHSCAAKEMHEARPATTADHEGPLKNADDDRYWRDAKGQWWFRSAIGTRVRASIRICQVCSQNYLGTVFTKKNRTCSHECGMALFHREHPGHTAGKKSVHWKGGKIETPTGYVMEYAPDHPSVQGTTRKYVLEHRLVMEKKLGRLLLPTEHVHHKNGVRNDNRLRNLELWVKSHPYGQRPHEQKHCPTCTCGEPSA